jgi:peptidoglycan/xylan/chitin deacetylase (PgdA/CDA1 family)
MGGAVVAARELRLTSRDDVRSVEPTVTVAAPRPTGTPVASAFKPVVEPAAVQTQRPTVAPPKPTGMPTRIATVAASPAVAAAPSVTANASPTAQSTPPPVAASGKAVALTFDAGADRGYAEDILDQLQEENVVASFGITGVWAKANPDLVRRMAADGHLVFNHTLDHRSFTGVSDKLGGLSAARRRAELEDADAILTPLLGHSTRPLYRLPYGDDDARVAADVLPAGYTHKVGWTVDSLGWQGSPSADIVARCLRLAAPGAIYVFHVGRASQDAIALQQVIHGLRDKGFAFHRVDQA